MLHRLHTLCFEYDESGGAADVDEPAADDSADEPVAEAPAGIDYSSPEFQEAVSAAAQQELGGLLQGLVSSEGQEGAEAVELDPYGDPDGFRGFLQSMVRQELDTIKPTVQAFEDQQNQTKIEEWCTTIPEIKEAQELLGEQAQDLPENFASQTAQLMATGYLRELEERYGPGERAVMQALKMASSQLKQFAKAGHDAGYQARNAELQGHVNARQPAPTAVESVQLQEQPADELAAAEIWSNRRGLL